MNTAPSRRPQLIFFGHKHSVNITISTQIGPLSLPGHFFFYCFVSRWSPWPPCSPAGWISVSPWNRRTVTLITTPESTKWWPVNEWNIIFLGVNYSFKDRIFRAMDPSVHYLVISDEQRNASANHEKAEQRWDQTLGGKTTRATLSNSRIVGADRKKSPEPPSTQRWVANGRSFDFEWLIPLRPILTEY